MRERVSELSRDRVIVILLRAPLGPQGSNSLIAAGTTKSTTPLTVGVVVLVYIHQVL
jgi:hypothetical protein